MLVLGAGATISEMSRPKTSVPSPPADTNFLSVAEECCTKQTKELWRTFGELWKGGEAYPLHHQRMEQIFAGTYLKTKQTLGTTREGRLARKLYDDLVILLRDTLYVTTKKPIPDEHLRLLERIMSNQPSQFDVISFKYDCLADRALREANARGLLRWTHKDGYGFTPSNQHAPTQRSTTMLLKLHGSMN